MMTEELSTLRLNRALKTQMYCMLVMMKTLYRGHNAGVNEGFARKRQFVKEWEPRFVELLRNALSLPTQRRHTDKVGDTETETVIETP